MEQKMMWYNNDLMYAFNKNIVEWDMKAASVSVSERYGLLDEETITKMKLMPKDVRTKKMGLIQREDKEFSKRLLECIMDARTHFLEENHIQEDQILSLHSDAVIFIAKGRVKSVVNGIEFVNKESHSSYIRYDKMEMFYNDGEILYKGIPDEMRQSQTMGLNRYLVKVFRMLEDNDPAVLDYISKFQRDYLQDKLPEYYYQSFGHIGEYKFENLNFLAYIAKIVIQEVSSW